MPVAEHLTEQDIANLVARKLTPVLLLDAAKHIAVCEPCGKKVRNASYSETRAIAFDEIKPQHLEYMQLEAYVDGLLNEIDKEIVDNHLSVCDRCFREIGDLNTIKAELAIKPKDVRAESQSGSFIDRIKAFLSGGMIPRYAVGFAMLLVVAFGIWFVLHQRRPVDVVIVPPKQDGSNSAVVSPDREPANKPANPIASLADQPITLNDNGTQVSIDGDGNISGLPDLSATQQELVKQALAGQTFKSPPAIRELAGHTSTLMGSPSDDTGFKVLSPKGTLIKTDHPTFRWQPLTGADSYTVTILDSDFNVVASSPELNSTDWTVPTFLPRKTVYLWQVTAVKVGKRITSPAAPAPEARFMIVDQAKVKDLDEAAQSANKSHLVLGSLYVQAGLLDDAEREFRALIRENPDSAVAKKMLRQVRSLRP